MDYREVFILKLLTRPHSVTPGAIALGQSGAKGVSVSRTCTYTHTYTHREEWPLALMGTECCSLVLKDSSGLPALLSH